MFLNPTSDSSQTVQAVAVRLNGSKLKPKLECSRNGQKVTRLDDRLQAWNNNIFGTAVAPITSRFPNPEMELLPLPKTNPVIVPPVRMLSIWSEIRRVTWLASQVRDAQFVALQAAT